MKLLLDSFWRAVAYCLHWQVIILSILPLVLMAALAWVLGSYFWEPAIDAVRSTLESWKLLAAAMSWLDSVGMTSARTALGPLVLVFVSIPVIVVLSLLLVASLMTPAILRLVARRRFPALERKQGGSFLAGVFGALWATVAALTVLLFSIPLWFIPPLVLIVPPLIWGWLTYRVMSYDVLADHASRDERRELLRRHRPMLFGMGVLTGYLGAAPSLVFAVSSVAALVFAPVLVIVAIWIYTLVFAFSSLWFVHYALAALQALRAEREGELLPPSARPSGELPLVETVNPPALPDTPR
jgi:hypothetical protein